MTELHIRFNPTGSSRFRLKHRFCQQIRPVPSFQGGNGLTSKLDKSPETRSPQ